MSHLDRDPWVNVKTFNGFQADHVISALQKEIRRGNAENAALLAYEMMLTSPALEDYLWQRLKVISVEDIGFGEPLAPVLIQSLFEMTSACDRSVGERKLYAVHAVRYLCLCKKDRSSDEMINWISHASKSGSLLPVMLLRRFQKAGHKPLPIVGGATGMIGDPSGKSEERNLLSVDQLQKNVAGIEGQLRRLLDSPPKDAELDAARRHLIGNFAIDRQRNAVHAAQTSLNALYGLGADASSSYPERIRAITGKDVLRVAQRIVSRRRA